jgi:serine/threonine-protein kinase HipA
MADRVLSVWIGDKNVGRFSARLLTSGGTEFEFEYGSGVGEGDLVSLTLPAQAGRRWTTTTFLPCFDMILPEGDRRHRIEEFAKIVRTDDFSLLSLVGRNPINRVRFSPLGESGDAVAPKLPTPSEILASKNGLALFAELVRTLDLQQGIAGVQPKILGQAEPDKTKLSFDLRNYRDSTHILKASSEKYPYLAANEFLCMQAVRKAGLEIPEIGLSDDGTLLLVKRFDIAPDGTHLGFEEAASLCGMQSREKYDGDYGFMIGQMAEYVEPAQGLELCGRLFKAIVMNWLLGNGDAHLKNFGLLYTTQRDARLAPIYDVVSTLPYIKDDVPALSLSDDYYSKAWWPLSKVVEFGRRQGQLEPKEVRVTMEECRAAVTDTLPVVKEYGQQIPGFADWSHSLSSTWEGRLEALRSD